MQMSRSVSSSVRPASRRASTVQVRASFDKLAQKPELKRPEETAKAPVAAAPAAASVAASPMSSKGVTIEYQRQRAKEMTKYFREMKLSEQIVKSKVFGWVPNNEISNGRWTMFGLLVGMLTEYATGVDFPDQIKLMCGYLGIVDVE